MYGWKGEGLGKNQDGLKTHVKVTKRSNQLGLGTEDTGSNNDRIDAYAGLKKAGNVQLQIFQTYLQV